MQGVRGCWLTHHNHARQSNPLECITAAEQAGVLHNLATPLAVLLHVREALLVDAVLKFGIGLDFQKLGAHQGVVFGEVAEVRNRLAGLGVAAFRDQITRREGHEPPEILDLANRALTC